MPWLGTSQSFRMSVPGWNPDKLFLSQLSLGAIDGTAAGRGDQEIRNSFSTAFKFLFKDGQKDGGTNICQ